MTSQAELQCDLLLSRYVASFEKLGEMSGFPGIDPFTRELATTEAAESGRVAWRPRREEPQPSLLEPLYARLPARLPPLFERLLLTFRWAEVDLQTYTLMANPPGSDLEGFVRQISGDRGLWEGLIPAGYLRFGKGADLDYDPVCFDVSSQRKSREMRVVKIDHEEILCNYKVREVAELAPSFEALVQGTIELADSA